MKTWDRESVRRQFATVAQNAERYANELADRIKRDPRGQSAFVQETHDEHLAKWYVYDSLSFSNCLDSREKLLAEVKLRLTTNSEYEAPGRFSKEDFERHWRRHMQALVDEYEKA